MFRMNSLTVQKSQEEPVQSKFTLKVKEAKLERGRTFIEELEINSGEVESVLQLENFNDCVAQVGELSHYLNVGDSCGEIEVTILENNKYSVLCETECEFAVFTREQFVEILKKQDLEKASFLKVIFPFLGATFGSSANLKTFLNCFHTEIYTRGSYIITEGEMDKNDPRFYIIQRGDCLLEKEHTVKVVSPYDKHQPIMYDKRHLPITKIGQLTIIGEEILLPNQNYEYSVKAASDIVLVQRVSRRSFQEPRFKEFYQYIVRMFAKKKKQRSMMFEAAKKDMEQRGVKREESLFIINNNNLTHLLNKSSLQSFSRSVQKVDKNSKSASLSNSLLISRPKPVISSDKKEQEKKIAQWEKDTAEERYNIITTTSTSKKPHFKEINSRLDYLERFPDEEKIDEGKQAQKVIQEKKFFAQTDLKYLRRYKSIVGKLTGQKFDQPDFLSISKQKVEPMSLLLKNLDKGATLNMSFSQCFTDVKDSPIHKESKNLDNSLLSPLVSSTCPATSMTNVSFMRFNAMTPNLAKNQGRKPRPSTANSSVSRSTVKSPEYRIKPSNDASFSSTLQKIGTIAIQGEFNVHSGYFSPKDATIADGLDDLSPIKLLRNISEVSASKEPFRRVSTWSVIEDGPEPEDKINKTMAARFSTRKSVNLKSAVIATPKAVEKINIRVMSASIRKATSPHNAKIKNALVNRNRVFKRTSLKAFDIYEPNVVLKSKHLAL